MIEESAAAASAAWARLQERDPLVTDARIVVGTPDDVVAEIRALAEAGVDGVRLRPARLPADLTAITESVIPRASAAGILHSDRRIAHPSPAPRPPASGQPLRRTGGLRMTRRQIHLAAHFPGVNNTTVWTDPSAGSQIDFSSFEHFARNAERGLFDYLFLAEGLRLREHRGRIHDLDVLGRPNTLAILAAIAAVTEHIGLVGTLSTTFNEPYELARQLSTLDHLSNGRAGWNAVTSSDAFHGANFRRGGYLAHGDRYRRASEFAALSKQLWSSWRPDAIEADAESGAFLRDDAVEIASPPHRSLRRRRAVRRAHLAAAPPGDRPGRRLRRWSRLRHRARRRHLLAAHRVRGRAGVLPRREGPPARGRAAKRTT